MIKYSYGACEKNGTRKVTTTTYCAVTRSQNIIYPGTKSTIRLDFVSGVEAC